MKNKKLIAIVAAVCAVILIGTLVIVQIAGKAGHTDPSSESTAVSSGEGTDPSASSTGAESGGEESLAEGSSGGTEGISGESATESREPDTPSYPTVPESQVSSDPAGGVVAFPYAIPNTGLTIQKIASYDGIFLEDGSDSSVSGIYSIVLKNTGSTDVEFARITLSCDGTPITFELSDLPSGATIVAQERSQTAYRDGTYRDCNADVAEVDGLEQSAGKISVQENKDGSLTISNLTDSLIPCVRVFYKFYLSDEDVYVGGITYTIKLTDLEAGGSLTVTPSHYSLGYSKVVMIRTYDSKD